MMSQLFDPLTLRGLTLRNRIGVSPMCQYSCKDGFATDWHLVHLGSRAIGGAGLVMMEATAVTPEGRISPADHGLWSQAHVEPLQRLTRFLKEHGAAPGIQLAHAGRKARRQAPWLGDGEVADSSWTVLGPSALPFAPNFATPRAMSAEDLSAVISAFSEAAKRALQAGFEVLELHAAHGYLLHSFLSPLSNHRTDAYGGSFAGRCRLLLEVTREVRGVWPEGLPLFVRLSCTDWTSGGWTAEDSVALARLLKAEGVDLIDCSSGGNVPDAKIPVGANYQVPFAEQIRRDAGVATAAVGMLTEPMQADAVVRTGQADLVLLARELLRDPYWPLHAVTTLHARNAPVPPQYARAFPPPRPVS